MENNIKQPLEAVVSNTSMLPENTENCNSTENKKASFLLYNEQIEVFEALTNEQAGELIKAIYKYANNKPFELSELLNVIFIPIRQQIDRNVEKYEAIKQKRKIAGAKGGKQKTANQANAIFAKQDIANQAVNDNDNVNVNVNDNDIYKEKINKKESEKIPTKEEIKKYCEERKSNIDVEQFYLYYSDRNWKNKDGNFVNWKLCVITWEKNDKKYNSNKVSEGEYVYNPNL